MDDYKPEKKAPEYNFVIPARKEDHYPNEISNLMQYSDTAGKYFVYLVLGVTANDSAELNNMYAFIYKNGSEYKAAHFNFAGNPIRYATATANAIITFDSDDYIEAYVQTADAAGNADVQPGVYTTFGAYKMIGI